MEQHYKEIEDQIEEETDFVKELGKEFFAKKNTKKEYLNKLDRFLNQLPFQRFWEVKLSLQGY